MIASILIAMGVAFAPAAAEPRNPAPQPVPSATSARPEAKRYCVMDLTATGTRIPKRVCHTRTEWLQEGYDPVKDK